MKYNHWQYSENNKFIINIGKRKVRVPFFFAAKPIKERTKIIFYLYFHETVV